MVSATTQLKLTASDGKKYKTDVISQAGVEQLAKSIRNQRAMVFLDWFKYSENTIDGRSKKKAYTLIESNLVSDKDVGTVKALQQIHAYILVVSMILLVRYVPKPFGKTVPSSAAQSI